MTGSARTRARRGDEIHVDPRDLAMTLHLAMIEQCLDHLEAHYDPAAADRVAFIIRPEGDHADAVYGFRSRDELGGLLLELADGSGQDGYTLLAAELLAHTTPEPGILLCVVATEDLAACYTVRAPWIAGPRERRPADPRKRPYVAQVTRSRRAER